MDDNGWEYHQDERDKMAGCAAVMFAAIMILGALAFGIGMAIRSMM